LIKSREPLKQKVPFKETVRESYKNFRFLNTEPSTSSLRAQGGEKFEIIFKP